eukprot:m.101792 g.101792  ORF g.101792 m.101792 type:complete len:318 (-) comp27351_c0_seq1:11-964(-)
MASLAKVVGLGRDRRRRRCTHTTVFNHDNLCKEIHLALPDWMVIAPPEGVTAPSGFPLENSLEAQEALRDFLPPTNETRDYEDMLEGHCETVAAALSLTLVEYLQTTKKTKDVPVGILKTAYDTMATKLETSEVASQIEQLFKPAACAVGKERWRMWETLMGSPVIINRQSDFLLQHTIGGSPSWKKLVQAFVARCRKEKLSTCALPMYVMAYIWDGDELTNKELNIEGVETAQYSIHAIGLVFDFGSQTVYLADPNGPLLQGGGMEFVEVPFKKLAKGVKATTAVSQWDRKEQLENATEVAAETETDQATKRRRVD